MLKMKFKRDADTKADLSEWNFGFEGGELTNVLKKELQRMLDIFFSENGAEAWFSFNFIYTEPEELRIRCDIEIEDAVPYATAETTLRELLLDQAWGIGDDGRKLISEALRALANEVEEYNEATEIRSAKPDTPT